MYYDNKNPFERDSYRDLMCRDAKQSFSRFSLGIFAYVAVSYLFVILLDVILFIVLRDAYVKVNENVYYQWAVGVLPMYIIGLPLLYVIVRNMPRRSLPKSKLSLGEFLCFFAISRALMIIGNVIGNTLNGFFASLRGDEISNSTAELIDNSPVWITLIIAVIIGPIIEEFIFRKLLIDRLSVYGTVITVVVSGITFGLFHGNFYQFFYSAMLGMLLAYITIKTGNWLYAVLLHIITNFLGSVAITPILKMSEKLTQEMEALEAGLPIDIRTIVTHSLAVTSYSIVQYAIVIVGIVLLVLAYTHKWYKLKNTAEFNIPKEDVFSVAFLNTGSLLFTIISLILFALSILLG